MPIGMVPKPHSSNLHLVTDHSTGDHMLNSFIVHTNSSIKLDNLQHFGMILRTVIAEHSRTPTWLFKSDVSAAYCRIPMHPLWQIKQINTFQGQWHVYHNLCLSLPRPLTLHGRCLVIWDGPNTSPLWTIWVMVPMQTSETTTPLWWIGPPTCQKEAGVRQIPRDHWHGCQPYQHDYVYVAKFSQRPYLGQLSLHWYLTVNETSCNWMAEDPGLD